MNLCIYPPHTHNLPAELMHSRCGRVFMILTEFGTCWPAKVQGRHGTISLLRLMCAVNWNLFDDLSQRNTNLSTLKEIESWRCQSELFLNKFSHETLHNQHLLLFHKYFTKTWVEMHFMNCSNWEINTIWRKLCVFSETR